MSKLIWITGLAGSGKTTIGKEVFKKLKETDSASVIIDGDYYRNVFGSTGYTKDERLDTAKNLVKFCQFLIKQKTCQ